jgi:peptidoglycan/LPS O-acetylase OafA/YrhL
MAVAVLGVEMEDGRVSLPTHWRRIAVALSLAIFIPCAWTMHQGEHSYLLQNTGQALAIAIAFAAIVMPRFPGEKPARVAHWLNARYLVAVGVVSYSVFLWHLPLIDWLADHDLTREGWGGLLVNTLIVAVLVGGFSAISYRYVEKPALRHKRSSQDPRTIAGQSLLAGGGGADAAQVLHGADGEEEAPRPRPLSA